MSNQISVRVIITTSDGTEHSVKSSIPMSEVEAVGIKKASSDLCEFMINRMEIEL